MSKMSCEPIVLIAAFVLAVSLTDAASLHPALLLGAIAGVVYIGLLVRRELRCPTPLRRTTGER